MKKKLTVVALFTYIIGVAQCPAPSNIIVTNTNPNEAALYWTENGSATLWEIAVLPDTDIGTIPNSGIISTTNSIIITALPPTGCVIFYVRSVCSVTENSPWTLVANGACNTATIDYIASLSNKRFDNQKLNIYPNPTTSLININSPLDVKSIALYDTLGRLLLSQEVNKSSFVLDISNQNKGIYLLKISTVNSNKIEKIIKE